MINNKIRSVVVVEGKKDTQRLRLIDPNVRTIETRGAAVDKDIVALIKKVSKTEEVVVLTDPDFSGERIRRIISQQVSGIKHAFLRQKDAIPGKESHHASLGVEHAPEKAIIRALNEVSREEKEKPKLINKLDLMKLKLLNSPEARIRREYISEKLNLGHVNGNHLAERLQLLGVSLSDLKNILEKKDHE
ncbi:ribonuclease M5 [Xylocopilactobacillus apis]|uniref:Ribonuclease M5 n=1 Tax=Xylocopilactobacillus apis TaxID=2932183 RepID=A0AAU9D1J3_9LACO|nr:ribonuclease M5 [Xylocopilactobacillus apis]BDR56351.1 ribonuclease M5 [Xylocopilactobacillus apis]